MNKTIEGFQIDNNRGFNANNLGERGRIIAARRGLNPDARGGTNSVSDSDASTTCYDYNTNEREIGTCKTNVNGFERNGTKLGWWQLGDKTGDAGTGVVNNSTFEERLDTEKNYLGNTPEITQERVNKYGEFKTKYFTYLKNQYEYLRVILDDKIANIKTDDRISDYNANQTDIRKYQINQLEAAKDNDMIVLLTILMIVLIICMVPVILGYQGIIEKDIVIMAAGGIFSLFLLYLLKYIFIDSALRSDKYAYKYDFKKPTDADLSESKDYDKVINQGGSGRRVDSNGCPTTDRPGVGVTDFDLDDEQGGIDRAQMGSDVEDSIGDNYASDRTCESRTIY